MIKTRSKLFAASGALALALTASACGKYNDDRGTGDAPAGQVTKQRVDVVPMPDHYGNVAIACYKGNGLYVVTHDKSDVPVTVVPNDPVCANVQR